MSSKYKLDENQWLEFKAEMIRQNIPLNREKRNVVQNYLWVITMREIKEYGSVAAYKKFMEKADALTEERLKECKKYYLDWTAEYGRSRKVGDEVLFIDTGGIGGCQPYDPIFMKDCMKMLTITKIESRFIHTDHEYITCSNSPRRRRGIFYVKSGKNFDMPTGQGRLVIKAEGFYLDKVEKRKPTHLL